MATAKKSARRKPSRARAGKRRFSTGMRLLLLVGAALAVLGFAYRQPLTDQARLGAAYGARIGCSCHFLDGREAGSCRADFEPGMEIVMLSVDDDAKSVTARVPGLASETAHWRRGWGCVLDNWED